MAGLAAGIAGLAVVGAVLVVGSDDPPDPEEAEAVPTTPAFSIGDSTRLAGALSAAENADFSMAFAPYLRPGIERFRPGEISLPVGTTVKIDIATFRRTGAHLAEVDAELAGPEPGRWRLFLHYVDAWLIWGTAAQ